MTILPSVVVRKKYIRSCTEKAKSEPNVNRLVLFLSGAVKSVDHVRFQIPLWLIFRFNMYVKPFHIHKLFIKTY